MEKENTYKVELALDLVSFEKLMLLKRHEFDILHFFKLQLDMAHTHFLESGDLSQVYKKFYRENKGFMNIFDAMAEEE